MKGVFVAILAILVSCSPAAGSQAQPSTSPARPFGPVPDAAADAGSDDAPSGASTPVADADAADRGSAFDAVRGTHRTLELRWALAWNRHGAGQAGADHENDSGTVTMGLDADGRSEVADRGETVESVLDGDRFNETSTRWHTTWLGTWKLTGSTLSLNLRRDKTSCVRKETERRGAQMSLPAKTACSAGVVDLVLECAEQKIDVAPRIDDLKAKPTPTSMWECRPVESAAGSIGTPFPWVFGKAGCVERAGGISLSGPARYAHCT